MSTSNNNDRREQLRANLGRVNSLLARLKQLQARATAAAAAGAPPAAGGDGASASATGQQQQEEDERHSSSGGGAGTHEDEGKAGSIAFTKERSAVGARMTVASSSSAVKRAEEDEEEDEEHEEHDDGPPAAAASPPPPPPPPPLPRKEQQQQQQPEEGGVGQEIWRVCSEILASLTKSGKDAWVFNQPVQVLWPSLVDYHKVIQTPMDLGTVKKRMDSGYYRSPLEYARDVRLTFQNSIQYNKEGTLYHTLAKRLLHKFDKSFRPIDRILLSPGTTSTPRPKPRPPRPVTFTTSPAPTRAPDVWDPPPQASKAALTVDVSDTTTNTTTTAVGAATGYVPEEPVVVSEYREPPPVTTTTMHHRDNRDHHDNHDVELPKIKGLNPRLGRQANSLAYGGPRPLSAKEKAKLSELIEAFPEDRLSKVFDILRKHQHGVLRNKSEGELELDLEALDESTQFELFRLAMNWQKSKKKYRKGKGGPDFDLGLRPAEDAFKEEIDVGGAGNDSPLRGNNSSSDSGSSSDSSTSGSSSSSGSSSHSESEGHAQEADATSSAAAAPSNHHPRDGGN